MKQKYVIDALRNLADRIESRGLRSAHFAVENEIISILASGEWEEHRAGPRQQIILSLEWADTEPVNTELGEKSKWRGERIR
jgi:hypothetical protein